MDYDMEVHIPQRIEALLMYKDQGNVEMFDNTLDAIKTLKKNHDVFLSGLKDDQRKRELGKHKLISDAQKRVLGAMDNKDIVQGFNVVPGILSWLEQGYRSVELEYMQDVLRTCVTYDEQEDDGEDDDVGGESGGV